MPSSRQTAERLFRRLPVQQRVLHLERGDRMDGLGSAERGRRHLAQPERPDLPLLTKPRHGPHRLLDRDLGVHAVLVVEVDRVGAEPLQARLAGGPYVRRAAVHEVPTAVRASDLPELGGDDDVLPASGKGPSEQLLVVPPPVHVGGVEERHAQIEGSVNHRDRRGVVALSVGAGHRHAAEPERGHPGRAVPERSELHRVPPVCERVDAVSQPTRSSREKDQGTGLALRDRLGVVVIPGSVRP